MYIVVRVRDQGHSAFGASSDSSTESSERGSSTVCIGLVIGLNWVTVQHVPIFLAHFPSSALYTVCPKLYTGS